MREFAVVLPLGPLATGTPIDRRRWPLHVTIQSNVRADADLDVVVAAVRRSAEATDPILAEVDGEAWFGPGGSLLVNLVRSPDLRTAHDRVRAALRRSAGAISVDPAFDDAGYRPHVTATQEQRVHEGERLRLTTMVLIEIAPDGEVDVAVPLARFELTT